MYTVENLIGHLSGDWFDILEPNLDNICEKLNKINYSISPSMQNIFKFAELTDLSSIRVVILDQDPYTNSQQANGLSFSCDNASIPGSLNNIYKCLLTSKLIDKYPTTGKLHSWSKQGVLLLNASLTIGEDKTSHKYIWENYINTLITTISNKMGLIFLLWGDVKEKRRYINTQDTYIFEYIHPSPAVVCTDPTKTFVHCQHFIEVNKILNPPINWMPIEYGLSVEEGFEVKRFNSNDVIVFTDGSCYPNKASETSKGGYAALFVHGTYHDTIILGNLLYTQEHPYYATNIRAEGYAIWKVMMFLARNIDWQTCYIVTDSEFWINMFTKYMPAWSRSNSFKSNKNSDMTEYMWELYQSLTEYSLDSTEVSFPKKIIFKFVESHNKADADMPIGSYKRYCYEYNDHVDKLAKHARKSLSPNEYQETEVEYS